MINRWMVTEKINGMNIRLIQKPNYGDMLIRGRTDEASIPTHVLEYLMSYREKLKAIFTSDVEAILYGEMYGYKIKNGGWYRPGKTVSFRLFDVLVIDQCNPHQWWWLEWKNVCDVALKLGVETVPVLKHKATFAEAIQKLGRVSEVAWKEGEISRVHEGIVARAEPILFTQTG